MRYSIAVECFHPSFAVELLVPSLWSWGLVRNRPAMFETTFAKMVIRIHLLRNMLSTWHERSKSATTRRAPHKQPYSPVRVAQVGVAVWFTPANVSYVSRKPHTSRVATCAILCAFFAWAFVQMCVEISPSRDGVPLLCCIWSKHLNS